VPLGYHKISGLKYIPEFVKFLEKVAFGVSEIYTRKIVPMTPLNTVQLLAAQEENVCHICRADVKIDDDQYLFTAI
jgi:pyruvate carboxylase